MGVRDHARVKEENEELEEPEAEEAWDDVKELELDAKEVTAARKEEVGYMEGRAIWTTKPVTECWVKSGKAPVTVDG